MREYREIDGFPNYRVSNDGIVESRSSGEWRALKPSIHHGYMFLTLCAKSGYRVVRIHRLVAQAFIPNPDGLPVVRHLDGTRTNNHVGNLAWGTVSDNEMDKVRHGTWAPSAKLTAAQRMEAHELRESGMSYRQIGRRLGVTHVPIIKLLKGRTWRLS